jgi:hypothetical protein
MVDLDVAESIAATASDRITGQVFLALAALALVSFARLREDRSPLGATDDPVVTGTDDPA